MGFNRILIFGLLLLMVIGILLSFPAVRKQIGDFLRSFQTVQDDEKPELKERKSDKELCGTCHSEQSRDFRKKFRHAPFAKWFCTDCHTPHTVGTGKPGFKVDINRLCSTCHLNRLKSSAYPYQHKPYRNGYCTDCHDPHASDYKGLLRMSPGELCSSCHKMDLFFNLPVKHKPYEIGACLDCHNPHSSKYRGMARLPGKQLCFTCHYDRQNEQLMPVQHKPYRTGDCVNCHGPHATPAPKLLLLPGNKLCLACHTGISNKLKTGYVHTPVRQQCTKCHEPHASRKPALLPETRTELCYLCHSDMRAEFRKISRHPVGNGLLECDGCHDPHVGQGPKLVRKQGNALCYICHRALESTYEKLAHATKAKGPGGLGACTNCHVSHGSSWTPLLRDKQEPMCNNCHTKIAKARINHPFGEKYKDPWRGGTLHCTSCHGPHGTPYKQFTLLPNDATPNGLCYKCHGKKENGKYSVHLKIEPRNEPKPRSKTVVPPREANKSKAVNRKVVP